MSYVGYQRHYILICNRYLLENVISVMSPRATVELCWSTRRMKICTYSTQRNTVACDYNVFMINFIKENRVEQNRLLHYWGFAGRSFFFQTGWMEKSCFICFSLLQIMNYIDYFHGKTGMHRANTSNSIIQSKQAMNVVIINLPKTQYKFTEIFVDISPPTSAVPVTSNASGHSGLLRSAIHNNLCCWQKLSFRWSTQN